MRMSEVILSDDHTKKNIYSSLSTTTISKKKTQNSSREST